MSAQDVSKAPQIQTVADMMQTLEEEIKLIRSGAIDLSTARVLAKYRSLEIQTAQVAIHMLRMNRQGGKKPGGNTFNLTTGREVPTVEAVPASPAALGRPEGVPDSPPAEAAKPGQG